MENHSCEDEELVIQEVTLSAKQNSTSLKLPEKAQVRGESDEGEGEVGDDSSEEKISAYQLNQKQINEQPQPKPVEDYWTENIEDSDASSENDQEAVYSNPFRQAQLHTERTPTNLQSLGVMAQESYSRRGVQGSFGKTTIGQEISGNRLTFGSTPPSDHTVKVQRVQIEEQFSPSRFEFEQNLKQGLPIRSEHDESNCDSEFAEGQGNLINQTSGSRKKISRNEMSQRSLTPSDSNATSNALEHTFGDGELSGKNLLTGVASDSAISLTGDSLFNKETSPSLEVQQMLKFMEDIEETWEHQAFPEYIKQNKTLPADLSAKVTHQITQISVFYLLSREKQTFVLPPKQVSLLAKLAKQIVLYDNTNVPRQTRSQFTLTVLEMLKDSQKYLREKKDVNMNYSESSSHFNSQLELQQELEQQAEELVMPKHNHVESITSQSSIQHEKSPAAKSISSTQHSSKRTSLVDSKVLSRTSSYNKLGIQQDQKPKEIPRVQQRRLVAEQKRVQNMKNEQAGGLDIIQEPKHVQSVRQLESKNLVDQMIAQGNLKEQIKQLRKGFGSQKQLLVPQRIKQDSEKKSLLSSQIEANAQSVISLQIPSSGEMTPTAGSYQQEEVVKKVQTESNSAKRKVKKAANKHSSAKVKSKKSISKSFKGSPMQQSQRLMTQEDLHQSPKLKTSKSTKNSNLSQKHKKLLNISRDASLQLKQSQSSSVLVGQSLGSNSQSAAMPYRVSRMVQPTHPQQTQKQIQVIAEDTDDNDEWI